MKVLREISFRAGWGHAPLPDSVTVEVNYDCNFRCRSCTLWTKEFRRSRLGAQTRLSLVELKGLIAQLAEHGVGHIHFGGGEPFVRRDFLDIVASAKAHGMATSVFTNGSLIDAELARSIVASGLDRLSVSIDGPNAAIDDRARGVPGAFDRALRAIRSLKSEQRQAGPATPHLAIHCTLSANNFTSLPDMVDLARSLGVGRIVFQYVSSVGHETRERTNRMMGERVIGVHTFADLPPDMLLGEDQLRNLATIVARAKERAGLGVDCVLDPAVASGDKEALRTGVFPVTACDLPWRSAIITPVGDVVPCSMFTDYRMGNVRETPFREIWNSRRARNLRRRLGRKLPPLCRTCCVVHEDVPSLWQRVASKLLPAG
jgi:radical SAM protein with 4Fe4S-binding SPASM domain